MIRGPRRVVLSTIVFIVLLILLLILIDTQAQTAIIKLEAINRPTPVIVSPKAFKFPEKTAEVDLFEEAALQTCFFCSRIFSSLDAQLQSPNSPFFLRERLGHEYGNVSFDPYLYSEKDVVSEFIDRTGEWERVASRNFINIMEKRRVEVDNPVFVDIGGNLGWFTLLMTAHSYSVITFEPNPLNEMLIRSSMCRHQNMTKWTFLNKGLGNDTIKGRCRVGTDPNNVGNGGTMCDGDGDDPTASDILRLDDIFTAARLSALSINIGMIKIDVEGFERLVVAGGMSFLSSPSVPYLFIELISLPQFLEGCLIAYRLLKQMGWEMSTENFHGDLVDPLKLGFILLS